MANPWDQDPPEDSVQNPWDADPPSDTAVATASSAPTFGYLTEAPPVHPYARIGNWLTEFLKGTFHDSSVPITNPQAEMPGYVAGKQSMDVLRETSPYILAGAMTGGAALPLLESGTVGSIGAGAAIEGLSQAGANVFKQIVNQTDDPVSMLQDLGMGAAFSGVPASIATKIAPAGSKVVSDLAGEALGSLRGVMGEDVKSPVNMIDNAPPVTQAPDELPAPVSPAKQPTGDITLGSLGGIDDATLKDIAAKGEKLADPIKAPDYGTPIERFGLSEAPDNPGIGERVYRNLSRWAGKVIPGIAQQPVKRIETIQGQAILHAFDDTRGRIDAFRNVLAEKIDNIFKANPGLTAEQIRSGNAPAVKELTDALYVTAKEYGLDPNYVRNYLTQVTLPKYAKKLESGMDKLRAQLGPLLEQRNTDLAKNTSVAAAEYPRAVEAAIAQADPVIKEAANYLVESGQVKNVVEAFEVLGARTEEAGLERFGFKRLFRMPFEKARGYRLPPNFYEQDAKKLLNIYADETSKRIPLARAFGANGEKLQAAIDKIATYNPKEAAYISKVSDIFTGKAEQAGGWGAFGRGLSHLVIAGKIGTGLSTVANAFQTLSLTMGKAGAYRMVKGFGMMFTDAGKEIGTKVAGKARTYEEMFGGLSDKSLLGKLSHSLTTATGFNHTNYFNLFYSANVFKPFVEDLAKASKSSVGARARWAQQELADLGINWQKGITDDQLVAAVHKLSFDSQLMERITNSPMILNDPRWRPLFLLKKYTINQAIAAKDLIGQELSRGNALPIVRLVAGGFLGGEVAIEAKNRLTSLLSGENKYRKEDDWYDRVANDLAAVGTMGWLSDMFGADNPQQLGNNLTRFVTPAALEIAQSGIEEGVTVAKRSGSVGVGPALRKEAGDIVGVVGGGLAKTAVQRAVETSGDVAERTENRRNAEKAAINDLFVKGKTKEAQKRIALWNENNPEYGFKGKEFTNKSIKKIVKQRAEKKYEAEQ